jgi:hypothetical protein
MSLTKVSYSMITGDPVNVLDFGAKGDGVTDDSAAFIAAINYCVSFGYNKVKQLHIPTGNYLLSQNNVFGQWNSIDTSVYKGILGFTVTGDGMDNTKITLTNAGATDFYLWDNYSGSGTTAANNSLQFPTFENLTFIGNAASTGKVHAFRGYGAANGYPTQGLVFNRCRFSSFGTVYQAAGGVNESENTWNECHIDSCGTFFYSVNPQSVNHAFIACHAELMTSDVFNFVGGGNITVLGGSYILSGATSSSYILKLNPPNNVGTGCTYRFINIRTEMYGQYAKILSYTGQTNDSIVVFDTCYFGETIGASTPTDSININAQCYGAVTFTNSVINSHGVTWIDGAAAFYYSQAPWPILTFDACKNFTSANIVYPTTGIGQTRIVNNGQLDYDGSTLGKVLGNTTRSAALKVKVYSGWFIRFPNDTGGGGSIVLPVGSLIKGIKVRKTAFGASTATYQLQVVDGAGTPIVIPAYATGTNTSTVGFRNIQHNIVIDNLMQYVTNTTNGTVTLTTSVGNAGDGVVQDLLAGDYFLVEYY